MKKILIVLTAVLLSLPAFSQAPSKMSYQAVVRNSLNSLVTNRPVSMRVSILRGSSSGIPVYVETQTSNTNDNGLLTLQIGNGTVLSGNIDSIDWSTNQYFIKTETDPNGGVNYSIVGTSQLLSVPYALYARSSGNAIQGPQGPQGAQGIQGPPGTAGITTSVNNVQHVNGNITLTQANIGLGNVDNTSDINKPISTAAQTAIDLKSDINSPTFSGTPLAPTPAPGTNTNQLATTAFVQDAVSSSIAVDATTSTTGIVRLAGDLGGAGSTASAPIISNNAITSSKIQNGTITNSDISSSAAIPFSKLNISYTDITSLGIPGTDTDTQYGAGTGLTLSGTTFNIDPSVVTNNYAGTVTATGFIGDGSQLTNIAATSVANNSVTSAKIVDGTIGNADISSSAAIPFTKLNISYNDITSLGIPGTDTDTQYGAGTGLSLTGTTFNIDPSVVTNNYPGTVTATGFVGDGSQLTNIAATSVANNSVTSAKIVDGTIGNADISSSAAIPFTKLNISYNDITSLGIPGTDTDTQYGAGTGLSLTGTTFNIDPSVVTNNYPGTVTATGFIGDGSQLTNIAATSVANNSVTSAKIVDGTIGNADISSSAAIPFSKLNISFNDITSLGIPGTDTDTQYGAGTGLSLSGTTFNIDSSVVTNNYPGTITANAFIGDGSQLLGIIATTVDDNIVSSSKITDGTIMNIDISPTAAIPFSKLDITYNDITSLGIPGTDTQYGAGTGLTLSGTTFNIDPSVVTNNYSGTVTATGFIGDGSQLTNIAATSVANNSVTSAKIVDGTIGNADISSSAAIPFTKLNISYNDITSLGIPGTDTDTQYGAGTGISLTGTTFSIDPSVVTNNYSGTVTATGFIGDGSGLTNIAATSVANNSVTSAKIVDGTIGNADISSSAAIPFTKLNISYNDITSLGIPGTDTDTQYGAGTGISLTGTTFSIDPSVVTNNYSGTVTATGFIGDGSGLTNIAATSVANNSVTSAKIVDGTIGNADISSSAAIPFSKLNISYNDITSLGIPGTDTDTQYGAGTGISLTGTTFSIDPSVVTNNYSGTVTATGFIGDGSGLTNIAATSVANNSVTSAKIVDGTIGNADISSSAAIPFTKLNISYNDITSLGIPGTDTDTQYGAGTGISLSGTTFSIDPSVVTNNYSGTVTATGFIGDGSQLTNVAATSVANNSVTSATIDDGTITNADIATSAAIPFSKLNISYNDITSLGIPGTDTDTQYGAGTGISLSGTTFSIDASVVTNNYSGTVTATGFVGDGSGLTNVAATSVANNSVTSAKIDDGTITNADIATSAAIPFSKLNISYNDITSLGIPGTDTDTQYGAGTGLSLSGTTFSIASSVVTSNYSGSVTANAFIGDGSGLTNVEASSVANNSVTSAKIDDGTITNADIASSAAIPFSKLNVTKTDLGVYSSKLDAAGSIVQSSVTASPTHTLGTGIYQVSYPTVTFTAPIITATLQNIGFITATYSGGGVFTISTYDTSGTPTDLDFSLIVMEP